LETELLCLLMQVRRRDRRAYKEGLWCQNYLLLMVKNWSKKVVVSFKAPENLVVTIENLEVSKKV
jgi:hypothetical protein